MLLESQHKRTIFIAAPLALEKKGEFKAELVEADEYVLKTHDCLPLLTAIKRQIAKVKQKHYVLN